MWARFYEQFLPGNNKDPEQEPLLGNEENKAECSPNFLASATKKEPAHMKTRNDPKKETQAIENTDHQPNSRYHTSKKGDPLQFGLFPYKDSIWGYAGFDSNLPKVFLPGPSESKNTLKR